MQIHAMVTHEPLSTGEPFFVAQGIEIDVASQGATAEEALANLREAIELVIEDGGLLPSSPGVVKQLLVNV
jgi:predicted RNase H-like HicB family nuclease